MYKNLMDKIQVKADMTPYERGLQIGFGTIIIDEVFQINNVRLMKRADDETKCFLAFPAKKNEDGTYQNLCFLNDKECYELCLRSAVESLAMKNVMNEAKTNANVKVTLYEKDRLLGFATIDYDYITLKDVRIMKGEKGPFLAFPAMAREDGSYQELFHPVSREIRQKLTQDVLKEYQRQLSKKAEQTESKEREPPPRGLIR